MFASRKNLQADIKNLQADTSQLMKDLALLATEVTSKGKEKVEEGVSDLSVKYEDSVAELKQRAENLGREMRVFVGKAGKNVQAHPFAWMLGAVGVGLLLLKAPNVLGSRSR